MIGESEPYRVYILRSHMLSIIAFILTISQMVPEIFQRVAIAWISPRT